MSNQSPTKLTTADDEIYNMVQDLVKDVTMNVVRDEHGWLDKNIARGNETKAHCKRCGRGRG